MSEIIQKAQGVILSPGDVHINSALTNVSMSLMQDASQFIATRVFPIVPVQKQSDLYWSFDPEQFQEDKLRKRAPSTEAPVIGLTGSQEPYYAHVYAAAHDISDQTRDNADSVWNLDRFATEMLTSSALVSRENAFVRNFLAPGVWDSNWTGIPSGTPTGVQFLQWNNPASTPIDDIYRAATTIQAQTGRRPNKLVLGRRTFDVLINHPDIIDRVKYGQTAGAPARANEQALAQLFGLDEVLVSGAVSTTGGATDFVFGTGALLVYSPQAVGGTQTAAAGLTFSWTGYRGANGYGGRIFKFRMDHLRSDRIEIELAYDQRVTSSSLGLYMAEAVAAPA